MKMQENLEARLRELEFEQKATELAIWICELLDSPTDYNTFNEIFLAESIFGSRIQIGLYSDYLTNREFDVYLMSRVEKIFNKGEDYTGYFMAEYKYKAEFVLRTPNYAYHYLKVTRKALP